MQLLHKLTVRAADSSQVLLKVVKNPVTMHLPVGSRKYLTSFSATQLTMPKELAATASDEPIVVVVGGIARGKVLDLRKRPL